MWIVITALAVLAVLTTLNFWLIYRMAKNVVALMSALKIIDAYVGLTEQRHEISSSLFRFILGPQPPQDTIVVTEVDPSGMSN